MKILIHFDPGIKRDIYEASRLRKNIKGSLELNNIIWVDSIYALPDVCHLISPIDEPLAKEAKGEGLPIVISALYTEGDPSASFTSKDMFGELILTNKAKKFLEYADVILVPSDDAKTFLNRYIQDKRIEIVTPGVNSMRFEILDSCSEGAFRHYERFPEDQKYFITIGEYTDKKTLTSLRELASLLPEYRFFFVGGDYGGKSSSLNGANKKNPKNLTFLPILPDDLFRSALHDTYGFIYFDSMTFSSLICLESFASKTPVFKIGERKDPERVSKAFINVSSIKEMCDLLPSLSQLTREEAIMCGYQVAKDNSLANLGKSLKTIYDSLINKEGLKND